MNVKSYIFRTLIIAVAIFAQSLVAGTIINQATAPNKHHYVVVQLPYQEHDWNQAESDLSSTLGSRYHLATITSQQEQDFIADLLVDEGYTTQYWIGGYQNPLSTTNPAANWSWVTGEAWSYSNWSAGEPNDFNGPASEQHLGMVSDRSWSWNDQDNTWAIRGYVAERPVITMQIDIKPGSDDNCINLDSQGVVPVAILGSSSVDVQEINQSSVIFEGNAAREKGKSGKIGSFEDVNDDGYKDLVMQFPTPDLDLTADDTQGTLAGYLTDGTPFTGSDVVCIVPPSLGKNGAGQMTPTAFELAPNVPNPFNPSTRITYAIPEEANVTLEVYNVRGEKVASLVNGYQPAGIHSLQWNGTNDNGQFVPGGLYIARMTAGNVTQTIRMVLMK